MIKRIKKNILLLFLLLPQPMRTRAFFYKLMGLRCTRNPQLHSNVKVVGDYNNIHIGDNAEICSGAFLLAKDKILLGKNSTLAYQTTILTSANPNSKYNKLGRIYPPVSAPVVIGDNVWI